jgi:hypothetical protein
MAAEARVFRSAAEDVVNRVGQRSDRIQCDCEVLMAFITLAKIYWVIMQVMSFFVKVFNYGERPLKWGVR